MKFILSFTHIKHLIKNLINFLQPLTSFYGIYQNSTPKKKNSKKKKKRDNPPKKRHQFTQLISLSIHPDTNK